MSLKYKIQTLNLKSLINYFFTALFGSAINFLTQIPYKQWMLNGGMADDNALFWSIFWAYITATVVSFVPAKIFAFSAKSTGNTKRETLKFFIIAILALGVQEGLSIMFKKVVADPMLPQYSLLMREKISHLVGMAGSFMANFFGHKMITFRSTGIYDKFKVNK